MGSFSTNITLRTTQQISVTALRSAGREAYVSQPMNGCTVVYDRECDDQDIEVLKKLASSLSAKLKCAAPAVLIHDDDVLIYTRRRTSSWSSRHFGSRARPERATDSCSRPSGTRSLSPRWAFPPSP
ncbi:MAG: hypothetical protein WD825_13445 [Gemmatimonadaceae bacterium]